MLIVFNPAAGGRRRRRLACALDALGLQGLRPDVAETARPGHATELARDAADRGVAVVVAAGGDGTVAEVASGLAGTAASLGILPFGTANVLAWELGLPPGPEGAARVLAAGRAAVLRPGVARFGDGSSRLFVQMVGAGFDAAVVANLDLAWKRRVGKAAYVAQAARELFRYPFPPLAAALDGEAPETVAGAIVTKGRLYAGRHLLAPGAAPGERGFRVALFRGGGPAWAALYGAALPFDLLPRLPGVEIRRASRVRLAGAAAAGLVRVQADGDPAGALPVEIEDAPGPIRVVLPAAPGGFEARSRARLFPRKRNELAAWASDFRWEGASLGFDFDQP